ncbi:hypothetical protein CUR178_02874 [Leishmania enriettii]|uniref:Uncharacterized protein n=1 Tax=Leishmania enriettii TaxID=5663 RepID=A0A836H8U6_LEIEN|nr:hypothetical protein CUR178_02874 [Leishmania enriettii]
MRRAASPSCTETLRRTSGRQFMRCCSSRRRGWSASLASITRRARTSASSAWGEEDLLEAAAQTHCRGSRSPSETPAAQ